MKMGKKVKKKLPRNNIVLPMIKSRRSTKFRNKRNERSFQKEELQKDRDEE